MRRLVQTMFHNYGKIEMEIMTKKIMDTVDEFKRFGIHKLGVLEGKNKDDV